MEYYKGYICVTIEELTECERGPAIMSYVNYKQNVARKRINVVRPGKGLDNYALIDFKSLPQRFKVPYIAKWGDPEVKLKEAILSEEVLLDSVAKDWYQSYRVDGAALTDEKVDEYTLNASVANELLATMAKVESYRRSQRPSGAATIKDIVLEKANEMQTYHGHTLPLSWPRLSARLRAYKDEGYKAMVQGYLGNKHASKITEEGGRYMIALKCSQVPRYDNQQIFEEYNRVAEGRGWKPLKSPNSVTNFLNSPEVKPLWYGVVVGSKAAKQLYSRKHKTVLPEVRDALWYGDGTKLNLFYRGVDEKGRTKVMTTNVYEVIDAYSEIFIGYCISDTENYEAQYIAYRMAVETAQCRPFEIVNDNQGGHRKLEAQGLFSRIARLSRRTAPDNGSSKTIESVFGRFQKKVLARDWRFTGQNITARGELSQIDRDRIDANKDSLYTLEELKVAYAAAREVWNSQLHHKYARPRKELYAESINELAQPLTAGDMVDMFWTTTERESTFTNSGLTITVDNRKYTYEVYDDVGMPDLAWRRTNTYRKFVVKYDPYDMTCVRFFTKEANGALRFATEARPYFEVRRAVQEQQPGDMEFIRRMDEAVKQDRVNLYLETAQLEIEHGVAPEQHGLRRPKVSGISKKSIDRFMNRAIEGTEEEVNSSRYNKMISNETQDNISKYSKF